ncbi:hypothetical protein [Streptomyces roseolus]
MEKTEPEASQPGFPVPPSGLSPALRARSEAGWREFLDRCFAEWERERQ